MSATKFEGHFTGPIAPVGDTVWGWTKLQYCIAWTYFKDYEFTVESGMTPDELAEHLMVALADLKNMWIQQFRYDPGTGPMQIYDPAIANTKSAWVDSMFQAIEIHHMSARVRN